jgi:hypothetical protein
MVRPMGCLLFRQRGASEGDRRQVHTGGHACVPDSRVLVRRPLWREHAVRPHTRRRPAACSSAMQERPTPERRCRFQGREQLCAPLKPECAGTNLRRRDRFVRRPLSRDRRRLPHPNLGRPSQVALQASRGTSAQQPAAKDSPSGCLWIGAVSARADRMAAVSATAEPDGSAGAR